MARYFTPSQFNNRLQPWETATAEEVRRRVSEIIELADLGLAAKSRPVFPSSRGGEYRKH